MIEARIFEEPRTVARQVLESRLFILLVLAVCVDLLFIATELAVLASDGLAGTSVPGENLLSLRADWGIPEIWRYLKTIVVVVLFTRAYLRHSELVFGSWAFVFLLIVLDDALLIHERLGDLVGSWLSVGSGDIEAGEVGGLFIWSGLGLLALSVLVYGHQRSGDLARQVSRVFGWILGLLLFFAIGFDTLLALLSAVSGFATGAQIVEDGGELLVLSLALIATFATVGLPDLPAWFAAAPDSSPVPDKNIDLDAELVDLTDAELVEVDLVEGSEAISGVESTDEADS